MLIGVELIAELVKTVILTGRVKGIPPLSLFLIAPPESGKTSIALENPCKAALALTDITGGGIDRLCETQPELTHFIINDFGMVTAHKHTVSALTIARLTALTEEGIQATAYPTGIQKFKNGRRGIIGCVPTQLATDGRQWWVRTGFASRMLPFNYVHSTELVIRIKTSIQSNAMIRPTEKTDAPKKEFAIPAASIYVRVDKESVKFCRAISDFRSKQMREVGYRRLKHYLALARAHALLRTWKNPSVTKTDLEFLRSIDGYVSYTVSKPI